MDHLSKFWALPRREKQASCEALILLLLSQMAVRTIAFRHIYKCLRALWKDDILATSHRADDIRLVNLSLSRVADRLPWKSLCLSRSITAFIMLRRRGVPAVMLTGVKSDNSSLIAHAWVRVGHGMIDESSENATFTVVMRIGDDRADP